MSFTLIKKNPTAGEVTSSLTSEAGGLHFDGVAGNIDLATPPDLGTKFSFEFVIKADAWASDTAKRIIDFGTGGRFAIGTNTSDANIKIYDTDWRDFGVAVLDDLKVHHIVITVDGTAAILFDNGVSVGTATLGANATIDACSDAKIGTYFNGGGGFFNGTISRTRFYNRALSGSEIKKLFENQNLEYSEMWASQTQIVGSDFSSATQNFNGNGGATAANIDSIGGQNDVLRFTIDSANANHQVMKSIDNTTGKKYRIQGKVYIPSANSLIDGVQINENGSAGVAVIATINATDTWTSFDVEHIWTGYDEIRFRALDGTATVFAGNGSDVFYLKDITVNAVGCVSSYELQTANPTQSLMVQDSSGASDATCSASGISQIQPLTQINAVAARIGSGAVSPADNELIAGKLTVGDSTSNELLVGFESSSQDFGIGSNGTNFMIGTSATDLDTGNLVTISSAGAFSVTNGNMAVKKSTGVGNTVLKVENDNSGNAAVLELEGKRTGDNDSSQIQFSNSGEIISAIKAYRSGANDAGKLELFTSASGSSGLTSRMSISSAGQVSIGAGSGQLLNVYQVGDSGNDYFEGGVKIGGASATLGGFLGYNSSASGSVNITNLNPSGGANSKINLGFGAAVDGTPATNVMTLDQTGLATFTGEVNCTGLTISNQTNTATGTRASSKFDHYEEGVFTVTLGGASSVTNTTGYYTRIGDTVHVWYNSGSLTSDGSAATISGLPFTVSANIYGGFFTYHNTYCPTASAGYFTVNATVGYFTAANATATATSASASGRYLMFTGTYKV